MQKRSIPLVAVVGLLIGTGLATGCSSDPKSCDTAEGCEDTAPADTADTAFSIDTPAISSFDINCDEKTESYIFTATLGGWANLVAIDMIDSYKPAWEESHEMNEIDYESDGSGSTWYLNLDWVRDLKSFEEGYTTTYADCSWPLTYKVTAYDYLTGEAFDCLVTGDDTALFDTTDCTVE
jgi:hypothetical protein